MSDNHSNSYNSQQSSQTFLAVPRLIQQSLEDQNHQQKNVVFYNPEDIQKSEQPESIAESQFSKQSQSQFRSSAKSSVQDDPFKQLQMDLDKLINSNNYRISRSRVTSQHKEEKINQSIRQRIASINDQNQNSRDSFSLSPQQIDVNSYLKVQKQGSNEYIPEVFEEGNLESQQIKIEQKNQVPFQSFWNNSFLLVIRAVGKMLKKTNQITIKPQLNFIQDKATLFKKPSKKAKKQKVIKTMEPDCNIRILWNIFIICVYLLSIVMGSFQLGFIQLQQIKTFQVVSIFIQLLDMLMNCNTQLWLHDKYIKNREIIIKESFKNYFWIDIIVMTCLFSSLYTSIKILEMIVLLRLNTIIKYWNNLIEFFQLDANFYQILYQVIIGFLLLHLLGCSWHYVGTILENSWLQDRESYSLAERYLISFHQSLRMGVGLRNEEILLSMANILAIFIYLCYIFSTFLKNEPSEINELKEMVQHFEQLGVSLKLIRKIKQSFQLKMKSKNKKDENYYFEKLDEDIIHQIKSQMYYSILEQSQLFKANLPKECIQALCRHLKYIRVPSGMTLIQKGEMCDKIFFKIQGSFLLQLTKDKKIEINQISMLEKQFILRTRAPASIVSDQESSVLYIRYDDFIEVIKEFDEAWERIAMYKDNQNFFLKNLDQCFICNSYRHFYHKCPNITYIPKYTNIIKEYNTSAEAQRKEQFRNDQKRFNTLRNFNLVSILGINFCISKLISQYCLGLDNSKVLQLDINNEVYAKLKGSSNNILEDSLFADDDKTSKQTLHESKKPELGTQFSNQSQQPLKADTEIESVNSLNYFQKSEVHPSLKVNVYKTADQKNEKSNQRITSMPKRTFSSGSMSLDKQLRQRNSQQNHQQINNSTSILQHSYQKSFTSIPQLSGSSPSPPIKEDVLPSSLQQESYQYLSDLNCFDKMFTFKFYFPAYNVEFVAIRVNQNQKEVDKKKQTKSRGFRKSITEIRPLRKHFQL